MKKPLNIKKLVLLNLPYILMGLFSTNFGEAWRIPRAAPTWRTTITAMRTSMRTAAQRMRGTNEIFHIQSPGTSDDAGPSAPAGAAGQASTAQGPPLSRL